MGSQEAPGWRPRAVLQIGQAMRLHACACMCGYPWGDCYATVSYAWQGHLNQNESPASAKAASVTPGWCVLKRKKSSPAGVMGPVLCCPHRVCGSGLSGARVHGHMPPLLTMFLDVGWFLLLSVPPALSLSLSLSLSLW